MRHFLSLTLLLALLPALCASQCTGCTNIAVSGTSYTLNDNQRLCIQSNVTNISVTCNGSPTYICFNNNVTCSFNTLNLNNTTISIPSGSAATITGTPNFNGAASTFNIAAGGTLLVSGGDLNNNYTINNSGTVTFSGASPFLSGSSAAINNNTGAVFQHTGTGTFVINNGPYITNDGTMTFAENMENRGGPQVNNNAGGTFTVRKRFYNHGSFLNNGSLQLPCDGTAAGACGIEMGDKGANKIFTNNACMNVYGDVMIQGATANNSVIHVFKPTGNTASLGNFTVNFAVTGNGRFIVENGYSSMTSAGSFPLNSSNKTTIGFWDKNTGGNNFDENASNNCHATNMTINTAAPVCTTTILPVTGLELQAKRTGNEVELSWSTISEHNTKSFAVEKANDGVSFSAITTQTAAGNSNAAKNYRYMDARVSLPVAYYRVKLTDIDGKTTYSNVVAVKMSTVSNGIQVFPNPASGPVFATFDQAGNYQVSLTDLSGRVIINKKMLVTAGQTITVERPAGNISGVYLMQVRNTVSGKQKSIKVTFE